MKRIPLTKGAVAIVDDADYGWLTQMGRWSLNSSGYAVHYQGRKTLLMHRLIMTAPPHLQVDHINHNRLDNRRDNLRLATRSENQVNKRLRCDNTSAYKGVSWNRGRWEARIRLPGGRVNLGRFDDPVQAARVHDAAAHYLYPDFATLNFPGEAIPPELTEYVQERIAIRG